METDADAKESDAEAEKFFNWFSGVYVLIVILILGGLAIGASRLSPDPIEVPAIERSQP